MKKKKKVRLHKAAYPLCVHGQIDFFDSCLFLLVYVVVPRGVIAFLDAFHCIVKG